MQTMRRQSEKGSQSLQTKKNKKLNQFPEPDHLVFRLQVIFSQD
jgi:hypothetical protein